MIKSMANNTLEQKKKMDWWTIVAFSIGVAFPVFSTFMNVIFTKVMGQNSIDTIISYGILAFLVFMSMIKDQGKNLDHFIVQSLKWMIVIYVIQKLNAMFNLELSGYVNKFSGTMIKKCVCGIGTAFLITNVLVVKKSIRFAAYLIFFAMFWIPFGDASFMSIISEDGDTFSGYMSFGYKMLPGVIMLFHLYFKEKKPIDLILAVVGMGELFAFANRGAVVAVIVYITLYQLLCTESTRKVRNVFILIVLGIIVYIAMQPENLLRIVEFLERFGLYSRNITKILDDTVVKSGREIIYELSFKELAKANLFGLGIFGDRVILNGSYPHNIFLEFLMQFGWGAGSILLCVLFGRIIYILTAKKYEILKAESLVFVCIIMIKLMLSSSYLFEYWFYFLFGYLINVEYICMKGRKEYNSVEEDSQESL